MAVTERQGQLGSWIKYKSGNEANAVADIFGAAEDTTSSSGTYFGSLLDFSVDFKGNKVTGTYNPSQGGGGSAVTQDAGFVQAAKDILGQQGNFSLGAAQAAVSGNQSPENPFFGEFFNYYLGLAQERQATLQKSLSRKDLLTGGDAASMLGGTLI